MMQKKRANVLLSIVVFICAVIAVNADTITLTAKRDNTLIEVCLDICVCGCVCGLKREREKFQYIPLLFSSFPLLVLSPLFSTVYLQTSHFIPIALPQRISYRRADLSHSPFVLSPLPLSLFLSVHPQRRPLSATIPTVLAMAFSRAV
jgi:hypothetical protein